MPSICLINGKYRALIRKKGHKPVSKWFDAEKEAWAWALKTEADIEAGLVVRSSRETVAQRIAKYRQMRANANPIGEQSSEHHLLNSIERSFGHAAADSVSVGDLLAWVQLRRDGEFSKDKKRKPNGFTCYMELSKLRVILRHTGGYPREVFEEATKQLMHFKLIDTANSRARRPTADELTAIQQYLEDTKGAVYADIVRFATITAMRRGEITSIRWEDLDHKQKMVLIRDRKDPVKKFGNDQWVPLLGESWAIVMRQPKTSDRIFPVVKQTVTTFFVQACQALQIDNLHLHDLRHEGISRMFEAGYQIPEVAIVSGHRDWKMLRRYTQITPASLHARGMNQSTQPRPDSQPSDSRPYTS